MTTTNDRPLSAEKSNQYLGTLVTLEGCDGSGKTTLWERLKEQYPDAVFTREPTNSWYGDAVYRSIQDDNADPIAELFLYMADHADHINRVIKPALNQGDLVICDRYIDSRIAYQAATLGSEFDNPHAYIEALHSAFTVVPDRTLYLDVDPETGAERSGETNKFEQISHLKKVAQHYQRLRTRYPDRFVTVDGEQSQITVKQQAVKEINEV